MKDIRTRSFVFLWGIVPVPTFLYDPSHAAQVVVTICMLLLWQKLRCILTMAYCWAGFSIVLILINSA